MIKRIIIYIGLVIIFFLFNFYYRPISKNNLINKDYRNSKAYINDLYYSNEYFKDKLLSKDEYYMYYSIINNSLNNKMRCSIECKSSNCESSFINSYYAIYLDHPELISFLGINSYKIENDRIIYDNYNNLNNLQIYFGTRRIEREIDIIKRETKNMSDKEKIIYVYDYVASHQYDRMFTYLGSNQSAYSFFSKGSSVCSGFAKASQLIFQNIGINSYLVLNSEHMWNYVEYKGEYYVFDATMGASLYNKKSEYFYEGLGNTTVDEVVGSYSDFYPKINTTTTLKSLFKL